MNESLSTSDPDVFELRRAEERRQAEKIRLIPSENYVSKAVREASGTVFTNKYSEGYPAKRCDEGQDFVDLLESVQPYSGSPASLAAHLTFLKPGDEIAARVLGDVREPTRRFPSPGISI